MDEQEQTIAPLPPRPARSSVMGHIQRPQRLGSCSSHHTKRLAAIPTPALLHSQHVQSVPPPRKPTAFTLFAEEPLFFFLLLFLK